MQDDNDTLDIVDKNDNYFFMSFDDFKDLYIPSMIGRTTCTLEIAHEIGMYIYKGLSLTDAVKAAGVPIKTVNYWISKGRKEVEKLIETHQNGEQPEMDYTVERIIYFYEVYNRAMALRKLDLLEGIRDKGASNWQSDAWILERIHPDEYGRKTKVFK